MVEQIYSLKTYPLFNMGYLIVVDYQSDAERKRIDYAIERWKDRVDITKPKGTIIYYDGDEVDEFLDDLYSRLSVGKDGVHVFVGDPYSTAITEQVKHLSYTTQMDAQSVERFLTYIMNKLGASFEGKRDGRKIYTAYTKKGQVGVDIALEKRDGNTEILLFIRGYGDVVSFVEERIDKELKVFLGDDGA